MSYYLYSQSRMRIVAQPVHAALAQYPAVCFVLALLTDIAYVQTELLTWYYFSGWLILVGLVMGTLAALAGAIGLFGAARNRSSGAVWLHAVLGVAVMVVALVNMLVHNRDGWTGVWPLGLTLSVVTVVLLLISNFIARRSVYRSDFGAQIAE